MVAWGDPQLGGDASEVQHLLTEAAPGEREGGAPSGSWLHSLVAKPAIRFLSFFKAFSCLVVVSI